MDVGTLCSTCLNSKWPVVNLDETVPHLEKLTYRDILLFCIQHPKTEHIGSVARLPAHICLRCSKALQVSYHFLKMLRSNETKMQKHLISTMDSAGERTEVRAGEVCSYQRCVENKPITWLDSKNIQPDFNYKESSGELDEKKLVVHEGKFLEEECFMDSEISSKAETRASDISDQNINIIPNENYVKLVLSTSMDSNDSNIIIGTDFLLSQNSAPFHKVEENIVNNELNFSHANECIDVNDNMEEDHHSSIDENFNGETKKTNLMDDTNSLTQNKYLDNGIKPLRCKFCNFVSCYFESMRKHYKKLHEKEVSDAFISAPMDSDTIPVKQEYHEIIYKCSMCNRQSYEQRVIALHLADDHRITYDIQSNILTRYNCPNCSRTFKDLRGMRVHYISAHVRKLKRENPKTQFKCSNCDKVFALNFSLQSHLRYCELRRETNCNICARKFSSIRQFEEHLTNIHSIEMIHECEVCGKTFKNHITLSAHRKRHTERYFQCELCPKNYINQCELKVHMERIHNTEIKEKCRICGATFTCIQNLRSHEIKTHFKKVYTCYYCEYKSTSVSSVRLHQYVHTGMPYRCENCPKEFALRGFMRQHAYNVHGVQLTEDELGDMFRKNVGYPSRYDAFSNSKYSLDIPEVNEEDIERELSEFGLNLQDIVQDLFKENGNDSVQRT